MFYAAVVPMSPTGEVLIAKRIEDGKWTCPAGGSEGNETPEETAVRECYEEAGLIIKKEDLMPLGVHEAQDGKACHCFMVITNQEKTSVKNDPDKEVNSWKWCAPSDFPKDMRDDEHRMKTVNQAVMTFMGIKKGGPGSGRKGHTTNRDNVVSLNSKLQEQQKPEKTKLQAHYEKLTGGAVLDGMQTKSGKPIFHDMNHSKAHGYDESDHRDAMNAHYDLMGKFNNAIAKMKDAGHDVPSEALKIRDFHQKQFKSHFKESQRVMERKEQVDKLTEDKTQKVKKLNKALVSMGHHSDTDVDTQKVIGEVDPYIEMLTDLMTGFEYGDAPRTMNIDAGQIHLVKVDDGMYTGYVVKTDMVENEATGEMEEISDTAKIRIERMQIPEIVKFLIAKEYILPKAVIPVEEFEPDDDMKDKIIDGLSATLEAQMQAEEEAKIDQIEESIDKERILDKKIALMNLVNKLLEV